MRKLLVTVGMLAGLTLAGSAIYSPASEAGWGTPFACGAGANTAEIKWDNGIEDPGATKPVLTGITVKLDEAADADSTDWSIDDLKAGKPLLVYRYVDGLAETGSENYKFSQAFEVKVLSKDDIITRINESWRAKKAPIPEGADAKKSENQVGVEFWAFTGQKLGSLDIDDKMTSRNFITALKRYESKNKAICDKEIKRLEAIEKAQREAEETAAK